MTIPFWLASETPADYSTDSFTGGPLCRHPRMIIFYGRNTGAATYDLNSDVEFVNFRTNLDKSGRAWPKHVWHRPPL
ncbi:hypothetical protein [Nonomuraea guangzhouensis]|uniref:Uncharacterized protein n=1 Tax=Nonomuraea guangzhouensis TaxID=1291555 RepID=A0ABW4GA39_9ACTN|nr:hypothetical protein [Nonomuraea guangzhouensis]